MSSQFKSILAGNTSIEFDQFANIVFAFFFHILSADENGATSNMCLFNLMRMLHMFLCFQSYLDLWRFEVETWPELPAIKKFVWQNAAEMGRVPFFVPSVDKMRAGMGVSWCTRLQAVCQLLLLLVPGTKMRLQMTSRSHGGWLRAVWWSGVTVTAPQNEQQSACLGASPGATLTPPPSISQRGPRHMPSFLRSDKKWHGLRTFF